MCSPINTSWYPNWSASCKRTRSRSNDSYRVLVGGCCGIINKPSSMGLTSPALFNGVQFPYDAPAERFEKPTALVPLPRVPLVRSGSYLAPHRQVRGAVIPIPCRQDVEREKASLLFGHHVVPEGADAADLDLHHVPRPHVRGGALRTQPDDVPRVERAVPADLGDMAGRVEKHVPGVELHVDLAINPYRGLQVVRVEVSGNPGAHGLEGIGVLRTPQGAVLKLPGALADVVADGIAQDTAQGVLCGEVLGRLANHCHQFPLDLEFIRRVFVLDDVLLMRDEGIIGPVAD